MVLPDPLRIASHGTTVVLAKFRDLLDAITNPLLRWGAANSMWIYTLGIKCCAIEMMSGLTIRFDADRFGMVPRASPRQCDLLIVNGPITYKFAPKMRTLYEQMADPKYVIAMGDCSICGGPFYDSYSVMEGVDKLFPVDVYVPGCPPRPETLIDGILKLQQKIKRGEIGRYRVPQDTVGVVTPQAKT